jgi:putative heme-binding domain-containing protein
MRCTVLALFLLASPAAAQPKQLPPELVAPTDALSPADERKAFTLHPGFDAQLVASEPDIQKPMQMAFDAKGRMWVTTSHHYPFPAPIGKGTDKLFVLSDFDPDTGKAKKVQTFCSDLNIPIGILPLPDGKSVIVSSVTEIRRYKIADGDGGPKSDGFEVLFSGFGYRDTHGMYNSYTLMPDGWVYACHGFNNDSRVKGKDGHEVVMNSGNTFRFRPDGSRIEVYTRGQVNPFGMCVDPWFNLYTADCHSKPMTQLIPGAYYESFGKPHDGLGFGPVMIGYEPGGTGMCGLAWYDADQYPKNYNGMMFLGNVVTNRVNVAKIEWHGSTPKAVQQPDFIASSDRWFRPVYITLGPDGALYIADFYNKIIGHYEVPLTHPQRDHDHGRIWRVVWKGKDGKVPGPKFAYSDLLGSGEKVLVKLMESPNLAVRLSAANQLATRGEKGINAFPRLTFPAQGTDVCRVYAPLLTLTEQAGLMTDQAYSQLPLIVAAGEKAAGVEDFVIGASRALASRKDWGEGCRTAAGTFLKFESPRVRRAAVEAVIFHPHADFVGPLIELLKKCPADDDHLRHAARVALRNCLRDDPNAWPAVDDKSNPDAIYAEMALAIPSQKAAAYLEDVFALKKLPAGVTTGTAAEHIARYGGVNTQIQLHQVLAKSNGPADTDGMLGYLRGWAAQGQKLTRDEATDIARRIDAEFRRLRQASAPPKPEYVKQFVGLTKVLVALPGATDRWSRVELPTGLLPDLIASVKTGSMTEVRATAAEAVLRLDPNKGIGSLRVVLADPKIPTELRDRLLLVFAASANKDARLDACDAIKDAPYRTAVAVGTALAGSPGGADDLLAAVKLGKAPARLLQEKAILERLRTAKIADLDKQIAALTKGLPPLDQRVAGVIKQRATAFASAKPDKELGAKLFAKHCAACHKIGEMGGKIAPQLDGIGLRGLERVLEDVLDPNRNVDQAFRARVILTKDEKTITGLMLRVEGEVVVVADQEGKEQRIPTKDIESNRETMLSPMPANFGEVIPDGEFPHLLAYLLDQKIPPMKKE